MMRSSSSILPIDSRTATPNSYMINSNYIPDPHNLIMDPDLNRHHHHHANNFQHRENHDDTSSNHHPTTTSMALPHLSSTPFDPYFGLLVQEADNHEAISNMIIASSSTMDDYIGESHTNNNNDVGGSSTHVIDFSRKAASDNPITSQQQQSQFNMNYHSAMNDSTAASTRKVHMMAALQEQQVLLAAVPGGAADRQQQMQNIIQATRSSSSPYRTQLQRESHILAERQRREEMNEKFTILRSMIPKLTKKDKASIVTDTINYIKELEKKVSFLQATRNSKRHGSTASLPSPTLSKKNAISTAGSVNNISALLRNADPDKSNHKQLPLTPLAQYKNGGNETDSATNHALIHRTSNTTATTTTTTNDSAEEATREQLISINQAGAATTPYSTSIMAADDIPHDLHNLQDPCNAAASTGTSSSALRRVKVGQVEIEDLGSNAAVIKLVTRRSRGVVLRLHVALVQDCKVDVIQSNVTTVGENMVHFVTIGLTVGISVKLIDVATTLQLAISSPSTTSTLGFGHEVAI